MEKGLRFILALMLPCCGIICDVPAGAELIEPTRNLEETSPAKGTLHVFSEPPGEKVLLDGEPIGLTPLMAVAVPPGLHKVSVGGKTTSILIPSGQRLRISLHRGEFIILPEDAPPAERQPKMPAEAPRPEPPVSGAQRSLRPPSPLYFPINPTGPIF